MNFFTIYLIIYNNHKLVKYFIRLQQHLTGIGTEIHFSFHSLRVSVTVYIIQDYE